MASDLDFTITRPLAGGAKNILDDLMALDAKIPQELERGVRENYLEPSKIASVAEKLNVPPPRIRTRRWVYVEHRQIQSVQVEAYDDEDALRIVRDSYGNDLRHGSIPYGFRQSYWADRPDRRSSTIVSEPTTTRPNLAHNLRFHVERGDEPRHLAEPATEATPASQADDAVRRVRVAGQALNQALNQAPRPRRIMESEII